ncbi:MAG: RsmB/NOP family class I SAM-dependent RNA methyltransferase [Rhizobiaceae bacterium]
MRLGGRLQAAIEIIDDIEKRHRPAAEALRDWGLSHRFAGSGDRSAIGNFVYDALRRKRTAQALLGGESGRASVIGAVLLSTSETPASLASAFGGDRFAPEPISEVEARAIDGFSSNSLTDDQRSDVPEWCVTELRSTFGDDWVNEAACLADRPPLDLRVNSIKAERNKVATALKRTGAKPCEIAPLGLRIPPISGHGRHPNVQAEPAFRKGWFEVQDEGSQIVAELAAQGSPKQVLDFCAGAGGKSLALSAAMDNKGQIHAHDTDRQRLAPIFDRLKRAGCRNVQIVADGGDLVSLEGRMDLVLVDAPCTGSGTWRRRPDAKWRLSNQQLETRRAEQAAILDEAVRYVRPGGRLVYVTCSVFHSENDKQIAQLLDKAPDYQLADPGSFWCSVFPEHIESVTISQFGVQLSPNKSGTDGFYFAALRRE